MENGCCCEQIPSCRETFHLVEDTVILSTDRVFAELSVTFAVSASYVGKCGVVWIPTGYV
jgi:hypothetical protein